MVQEAGHFLEEISVQEAAAKYGLTASQITKLARGKKIRGRKFGRDWILDEASLRSYVAQPRKTGPKSSKPQSSTEATQVQTASSAHCMPLSLDSTDWIQKTIEDLSHAVKAGQLSEEGRRVIVAQLAREKQVQELVRRTAQDHKKEVQ
jgi:hypothetical protein